MFKDLYFKLLIVYTLQLKVALDQASNIFMD